MGLISSQSLPQDKGTAFSVNSATMSTYAKNRRICEPSEPLSPEEIVSFSLCATMIILTIIIALISIPSLRKLRKLNKILQTLFITALISLSLFQTCSILIPITCHLINQRMAMIPMTFALFFYWTMMLTLLGSLITRLYITFDKSIYKINTITRNILNTLYSFTIIGFITPIALYTSAIEATSDNDLQKRISWTIYIAAIGFSCYMITAGFAVFLFARNMMKLTKSRATPEKRASITIGRRSTDLNAKQAMFIDKISRYVSLFTWAMCSTLITALSMFVAEAIPELFNGRFIYLLLISGSIDGVVNVICLTLQYSFAGMVYYRYCTWMECCWKAVFVRNAEKSLEQQVADVLEMEISTHSQGTGSPSEGKRIQFQE